MPESSDETLDASSEPLAAADRSRASFKGTMVPSNWTRPSPDVSDRGDERVVGEAGGEVGGGVEVGAKAGAVSSRHGGRGPPSRMVSV
jgi:hypothetical protein